MKKVYIGLFVIAVLVASSLLVGNLFRNPVDPSLQVALADLLPTGKESGWSFQDLPLGNTESMNRKAHELLQVTDYVYRRYSGNGYSIEVYVAYWAPGAMPARLMNGHTPDSCWVHAGWQISERRYDEIVSLGELKSEPGNWRRFEKAGTSLNVAFWHLLNGTSYSYAHQDLTTRLKQLVLDPFLPERRGRGEQFLIRISSEKSLDDCFKTSLMQEVFDQLKISGLFS